MVKKTEKVSPTLDHFNLVKQLSGITTTTAHAEVAYVVSEINEELDSQTSNIFLTNLDTRLTTQFTTSGGSNPAWSPDGSTLAFVANRGQGSQIFVVPLDGGEARQVTNGKGSALDPKWSPDGTKICYIKSVNEGAAPITAAEKNAPTVIQDIIFQYDGFGLRGNRRRHLFIVDIATGIQQQITHGDWHDTSASWSADGKNILFVSDRSKSRWNKSGQSAIWLIKAGGGKAKRLTPEQGAVMNPRISPDGKWVVYAGTLKASQSPHHKQLLTIKLTGAEQPQILLDSEKITPSHIGFSGSSIEWAKDSKSVLFLAAIKGTVPIWRIRLDSKRLSTVVEGDFQVDGMALTKNTCVCTSLWSTGLPEISLIEKKKLKPITNINKALRDSIKLVTTRRMTYQSFDDLDVEMFLLFPPGYKKGKRYPLAINIHGGPHAMHPAVYNPLVFQIMATAGYVVMLPNPRGSHSYGQAFQKACVEDWGGGDYQDIMIAVDHLISRKIIDENQLFVEGYSYGGIMTSWIVGQTRRFRAAVIGAPVTDMVSNFGTDDEPHFTVESMGGTPQQVPENYRNHSALTYVENVATPIQLQHFEGDLRCPIGQSEQYYMALKFLGREVEFVRYPGGSHVGRTPSQYKDMLSRTLEWFANHA